MMERPKRPQQEPAECPPLEGKLVRAVDPSAGSRWVNAVGTGDGPRRAGAPRSGVFSYSTGEHQQRCGFLQRQQQQEELLQRAPGDLKGWQSAIPTACTADKSRYLAHLGHVLPRLGEALAFHGSRRRRKGRWHCYMQRQRSLHRLAGLLATDNFGASAADQRRPKGEVRGCGCLLARRRLRGQVPPVASHNSRFCPSAQGLELLIIWPPRIKSSAARENEACLGPARRWWWRGGTHQRATTAASPGTIAAPPNSSSPSCASTRTWKSLTNSARPRWVVPFAAHACFFRLS